MKICSQLNKWGSTVEVEGPGFESWVQPNVFLCGVYMFSCVCGAFSRFSGLLPPSKDLQLG